jgi:hypothetical protein
MRAFSQPMMIHWSGLKLTRVLMGRVSTGYTLVFIGIALELTQLLSHTLFDGLFSDLDSSEDFSKSTLDSHCVLLVSLPPHK